MMAHCTCPNGHVMWNGDGVPDVWVFRMNFFKEFIKNHPYHLLGINDCNEIFDCFEMEDYASEELDCWYCDECKGFVVFANNNKYRYNYQLFDEKLKIEITSLNNWEEYIAFRDDEFSKFQEFYIGMNPLEALVNYPTKMKCYVSPNKETIYIFDNEGRFAYEYRLSWYKDFNQE